MNNPLTMLTDSDMSSTIKDTFNHFESERKSLEKKQSKQEIDNISKKMGLDVSKLSPAQLSVALDDARIVNRIDEDYKRINEYLIKTKNTCTFSEYRDNWFPLHELLYPEMEDYENKVKERRRLSSAYFERFLSTEPIRIVSDTNPEEVLAVLPPQYMPINTIQGDASRLIDIFSHHSADDQKHFLVQSGNALSRVIGALQNKDPETINKIRMLNFQANLKVLKLFNPDHPLLKKMEEIEKRKQVEEEKKLKNTENNNLNETQVLDDDSDFDFF